MTAYNLESVRGFPLRNILRICQLTREWQVDPEDDRYAVEITSRSRMVTRSLSGRQDRFVDYPVSNVLNMIESTAVFSILAKINELHYTLVECIEHVEAVKREYPCLSYSYHFFDLINRRNFNGYILVPPLIEIGEANDRVVDTFLREVDMFCDVF